MKDRLSTNLGTKSKVLRDRDVKSTEAEKFGGIYASNCLIGIFSLELFAKNYLSM